jgi:hypothetical protein
MMNADATPPSTIMLKITRNFVFTRLAMVHSQLKGAIQSLRSLRSVT